MLAENVHFCFQEHFRGFFVGFYSKSAVKTQIRKSGQNRRSDIIWRNISFFKLKMKIFAEKLKKIFFFSDFEI